MKNRSLHNTPTFAAAAILILMLAAASLRYQHFASLSTVTNLLGDYAFVGIAAIGATIVILSGGIDLSCGSVIACSSILIASLIEQGWHPLAAGLVAIIAGSCVGAAMGWLIHTHELPAFMVTLAGMFAVRACGFLIHPQSLSISHPFYALTRHAAIPLPADAGLQISAAAFLCILAIAWLFTTRTSFGRNIHALGGLERSARVMGLPIARTRIAVYGIAGFLSALAGFAFTMYKEAGDPASAIGLELDVIAAAVIGGTSLAGGAGSVVGTLIGILIVGTIRLIIDNEGTLSASWTSIATGILLLGFVALQRLAVHPRSS